MSTNATTGPSGRLVTKSGKVVYRYKGKFMSEKQYNKRSQMVEVAKRLNKEKRADNRGVVRKKCIVEGRRVIELQVMARFMQCMACEEPLHLVDIERESKFGLASLFHIRCKKCNLINFVPTGKHDGKGRHDGRTWSINTETVNACVNAGLDLKLFKKFLTILELPGENSKLFNPNLNEFIGPETKQASEERMRQEMKQQELAKKRELEAIRNATKKRRKKRKVDPTAQVETVNSASNKPQNNEKETVDNDEEEEEEEEEDNQNQSQSQPQPNVSQSNPSSTVTQSQSNSAGALRQCMSPDYVSYQQQLYSQYSNIHQNLQYSNAASTSRENFFAELYMTPKVAPKKVMMQQFNQMANQNQGQPSTSYNFQTNPLNYLP